MAIPGQLNIEVRERADRAILVLVGECDLANADRLEQAIESPAVTSKPMIVLDLERLEFMDSSGLRTILAGADGAAARGQRFAVTAPSEQVQRLLEVTGAAKRLTLLSASDEVPA